MRAPRCFALTPKGASVYAAILPEEIERFLEAWTADDTVMNRQPELISTQLDRGIGFGSVVIDDAVWESSSSNALYTLPSPLGLHISSKKLPVAGICVKANNNGSG
ncbi:MAG: hypothetical protein ABJC89_03520 [Acidobacteriota bacterium]